MGIFNRNFEEAITSNQAARIRGKMGVVNGNRFIKQTNNSYNKTNRGTVE